MRLDKEQPSQNVEDRRGRGGGFGMPGGGGGRGFRIPTGGRGGGFSISTIVLLAIAYFALKFIFGIDLLNLGGGGGLPAGFERVELPGGTTDVQPPAGGTAQVDCANITTGDALVKCVVGSTERIWTGIYKGFGKQYPAPKLIIFENFVQSACGQAQSAMGPFYCPRDQTVYIDLSFYQDMKSKLGAPGDFAQAYVIAHEVGHHVQNTFGILDKVMAARARVSEEEGNALQVRVELQADCFAGLWAQEANATAQILEAGDIEEGINAAEQIGDDRLQKKSQGYVVPDSFTHGSSEQRVRWFKRGLQAKSLNDCDTFATAEL